MAAERCPGIARINADAHLFMAFGSLYHRQEAHDLIMRVEIDVVADLKKFFKGAMGIGR